MTSPFRGRYHHLRPPPMRPVEGSAFAAASSPVAFARIRSKARRVCEGRRKKSGKSVKRHGGLSGAIWRECRGGIDTSV